MFGLMGAALSGTCTFGVFAANRSREIQVQFTCIEFKFPKAATVRELFEALAHIDGQLST
jgi:hypothetical protein